MARAGGGGSWAAEPGGAEALQSLVELLGLPVLEQGAAFNLANRHPLNLTGANAEVLKEADLILAVGVKDVEAALKRPVPDAGSRARRPATGIDRLRPTL